jgi:hypothetical protein
MRRLAVAVLLTCSLVVQAECARPKNASPQGVAGQSDEARLAFLSKLLEEESGRARTWAFVWGGTYGLLGVVQLAVMPLFPREEQPDWYWGAASTAFGLAFTLLGKPEVQDAGPLFATRASAATADDTCTLIAEGERLLEVGAENEDSSFAWYLHVGNVLFNVGIGLVLGLGYGHWEGGIINAIVGSAIGEANILSSPAHLISGWKRYRQGEVPSPVSFFVVPTAGPGLGVLMRF